MPQNNNKQQKFAQEYVIDCNGTQAAIRAGYSAKTADSKAAQLLVIVRVKQEIERIQAEQRISAGFDRGKSEALLFEAIVIARAQRNAAGITQAVRELNTLFGLHPDRGQLTLPYQLVIRRKAEPKLLKVAE